MLAAGNADAGAALLDVAGLEVIPTMITAQAPAAALRVAIEHAVAAWCRLVGFTRPETLPAVVDIYWGTMGCSPAAAAAGMHWSLRFNDAAFYGCRYADPDLTGVVVIHTRVPAEGIVLHISGTHHSEVVPAETPAVFEVITDKARIGDAAVRYALQRQEAVKQSGWCETGSYGGPERAARAVRERMAAAGVPRGASIVA